MSKLYLRKKSLIFFFLAFILVICIRLFAFEIYSVKSNSMEDTLHAGDIVVVNKLSYGGRIPNSLLEIPWLNVIPYIFFKQSSIDNLENKRKSTKRLYSFSKIKHNDIIVFNEPGNSSRFLIKRCVALPKDTFQICNSDIYINGQKQVDFVSVKKAYIVNHSNEDNSFSKITADLGINYKEDWLQRKMTTKHISLTSSQVKSLSTVINPELINEDISKQVEPEIIPYKGFEIKNCTKYNRIFRKYECDHNGDTSPFKKIVFKNDYYFFMGDNRNSSFDSRSFGVIPDNLIVGKITFILFSKPPGGKWRKERFLKRV